MENNDFEKFPGGRVENVGERTVAEGQDFERAFSKGVPEFAGEQFGVAHEGNEYYGEATDGAKNEERVDNEGVADAAALINYGLDAAARELGVEMVVQRVKGFDASKSEDPIKDLYEYLGVDTRQEQQDVQEEAEAAKPKEAEFRGETGMPKNMNRSVEGAREAIADMKELIAEVEGADPRYEELRAGARGAQMGYFEYAVKDFGVRGLTELFGVLAEQREKKAVEGEAGDTTENVVEELVEDKLGESADGAVVRKAAEEIAEEVESEGLEDEELADVVEEKLETLNPEILKKDIAKSGEVGPEELAGESLDAA